MSKSTKRTRARRLVKFQGDAAATGVNFSLFFSGLCAFVPYTDQGSGQLWMRVIMPDTEVAMQGMGDPIHTTVLLVKSDRVATGSRPPDFRFNGIPNGYGDRNIAVFLLRHEDLTIQNRDHTKPIVPTYPAKYPCPPSASPYYFDWIQGMPAGADWMTEDAFKKSYNKVMARVDLFDGPLSTSHFPADYTGKKTLKWYLDTVAGGTPVGTPRAIAEEIKFYKTWPSAVNVTISSSGGMDIILEPASASPIIEAWISNLPLIDILINRSAGAMMDRGKDVHFMRFHDLAVAPGVLIPWPDKNDKCAGNPTGGAANPRCPPALFSGFTAGT